jgi:hydroxylamine dehydrogenase
MKKNCYFLAVFLMAAFGAVFYICWQSETFHRLALPEEKIVITEGMKVCLDCHEQKYTPFVYKNWRYSKHALRGVGCDECHVNIDEATKVDIEKIAKIRGIEESKCDMKSVVNIVSPKVCAKCHGKQVGEFEKSKHGRAWSGGLQTHISIDKDGTFINLKKDCASCHQIEFKCNTCHVMHKFSLEEARRPEACGKCHSGDRHPQMEKYLNYTRHGLIYKSEGNKWQWSGSSEEWHKKFEENAHTPVCVTCHMPNGIHDVHHPEVKDPDKFVCAKCHVRRDEIAMHSIEHKSDGAKKYAREAAKRAKEGGIMMCVVCHPGGE